MTRGPGWSSGSTVQWIRPTHGPVFLRLIDQLIDCQVFPGPVIIFKFISKYKYYYYLYYIISLPQSTGQVDSVPQQLAQKIPALLESDLDSHDLFLGPSCGGKGLFSTKSIPEGEVILRATALLFTEKSKLMEVIRQHEEHTDACMKINGVLMENKPVTVLLAWFNSIAIFRFFSGVQLAGD